MEQAIKPERAGTPPLVLVAGSGESAVNKPGAVPVAACSVLDTSGAWDARAYARQWLSLAPLVAEGGPALYSYADRPDGGWPTMLPICPRSWPTPMLPSCARWWPCSAAAVDRMTNPLPPAPGRPRNMARAPI